MKNKFKGTAFYNCWQNMKKRCSNPNTENYEYYGARGITYDPNWESFNGFYQDLYKSYLEHVKLYGTKETTLDRINYDKNYTMENCRWATWQEQFNNRHSNVWININGEIKTLSEWRHSSGVPIETIWSRYNRGVVGIDLITIHKRPKLNKQSGIKGVRWCNRDSKWVIDKILDGKKKRIASFTEENLDSAINYYNKYILNRTNEEILKMIKEESYN